MIQLQPRDSALMFKCKEGINYYFYQHQKDFPKFCIGFNDKENHFCYDVWDNPIDITVDDFNSLYNKGYKIISAHFDHKEIANYNDYKEYVEKNNLDLVFLCKKIPLSSISELFKLTISVQVCGEKFDDYINVQDFRGKKTRLKYYDRIGISDFTEYQKQVLSNNGIMFIDSIEVNGDRFHSLMFIPSYNDIDGYNIVKTYYSLSEFGKEKPQEIIRKEEIFLDTKNPDPEIVRKLQSLPKPSVYHTFQEALFLEERFIRLYCKWKGIENYDDKH